MKNILWVVAGIAIGLGLRAYLKAQDTLQQPVAESSSAEVSPLGTAEATPESKTENLPVNPVFHDTPLEVRGYIKRGAAWNVVLSDGSTLTEQDAELEFVGRKHVVISGKKYPFKIPPPAKPQESGRGLAPTSSEGLSVPSEATARSREAKTSQSEEVAAIASPPTIVRFPESLTPAPASSSLMPSGKSRMSEFDVPPPQRSFRPTNRGSATSFGR